MNVNTPNTVPVAAMMSVALGAIMQRNEVPRRTALVQSSSYSGYVYLIIVMKNIAHYWPISACVQYILMNSGMQRDFLEKSVFVLLRRNFPITWNWSFMTKFKNLAIAPILEKIIADMVSYIVFIKYILYYPPSVTVSVYKSLA